MFKNQLMVGILASCWGFSAMAFPSDLVQEIDQAMRSGKAQYKILPQPADLMVVETSKGRVLVSTDRRILIENGKIHDIAHGRTIQNLKNIQNFHPVHLQGMDISRIGHFKYGNGEKNFLLFVDPTCEYSRALIQSVKNRKNDGTFWIVPVGLMGIKAEKTVQSWLCMEKPEDIMDVVNQEKDLPLKPCTDAREKDTEESIMQTQRLLTKFNITATPMVMTMEGKKIPGQIDIKNVLDMDAMDQDERSMKNDSNISSASGSRSQ